MKTFRILLEVDVVLTEGELWPDGDAPENPTVADVQELIRNEGGSAYLIRTWSLEECVTLHVSEGTP